MSNQYFKKVIFQDALDAAKYLTDLSAPQSTPYVHKYKARTILQQLIGKSPIPYPQLFMAYTLLGNLCLQTQQNSEAFKNFSQAFKFAQNLQNPEEYLIDLIELYNLFGFLLVQRDHNQQGLGFLGKAVLAYEFKKDFGDQPRIFDFYGGGPVSRAQQHHTLTLFYMAQTYTKMGFKDKGALYCGRTLKRQYQSKKYDPKQFVVNLFGLSDYYSQMNFYGQAHHLVETAHLLCPKTNTQLVGKCHLASGRMYSSMLNFGCRIINKQQTEGEQDQRILNKLVLELADVPKPLLKMPNKVQDCKQLFKKANVSFKSALQIFPLDGSVTQHIQTLFEVNKLYKFLSQIQTDIQRQLAMFDRRKGLFEEISKVLNPKAYISTYQTIIAQLYRIHIDMFDLRRFRIFGQAQDQTLEKGHQKKLKTMNQCAFKAIEYAERLIANAEDSKQTKDMEFHEMVLNLKFNVAKIYSKVFVYDNKQRVQFLKLSLRTYQKVKSDIEQVRKSLEPQSFAKQLELTKEMLDLLPSKIDRINYRPS